jgi:nucleoside-diphosphate-sugar epimerase
MHDAVIHFAALSNDPLGDLNAITYDTNYTASVRLARRAREAGVPRRGAGEPYNVHGRADLVIEGSEGPRFEPINYGKCLLATGRVDASPRWRTR